MGKYLLLERLATGGMAEVYRAKAGGAGGFEKQVAIKRILPSYSQNDEFRKMFEYEARLSSMLTHANIVQIYDFNKFGETYLLAMEYVDGKNLRQSINKSRKVGIVFSVEFSAFVINEVCKGLEYAHSKKDDNTGKQLNIIHRDMSPQNIMLSYEGAVKIVDFGIAKAKDRVDETRSGIIKGKFGYMSPEQANGMPVDHRTDIFSTGIILWELLTGRRLFAAESDMATLRMIQECVITPPSKINPRVNAELERIVMKALSKDLKLRYNSAGELHRSLLEYLSKTASSFTQQEVGATLQKVFAEEISKEKKRFEQLNRQSIPFSQGAPKSKGRKKSSDEEGMDMEGVEEALDGFQTKSDVVESTSETFSDAEFQSEERSEPDAPLATAISYTIDEEVSSEPGFGDSSATKSQLSVPTEGKTQVSSSGLQVPESSTEGNDLVFPGGSKLSTSKDQSNVPSKRGLVLDNEPPTPETRIHLSKESMPLASDTNSTGSREVPTPNEDSGASTLGEGSAPTKDAPRPKFEVNVGLEIEKSRPQPPPAFGTHRVFQQDRRQRSRPKKMIPTFVRFLIVISVTGYGYKLYLDGDVEQYFENKTNGRQLTNKPVERDDEVEANPVSVERKPGGDCSLNVLSIPPGAEVFEGKISRGFTPVILSGPCRRSVNISLRKEGYEYLSENVVIGSKVADWNRTLRAIPMGRLALNLGFNADIFLNGEQVREARARIPLEIPLRAKRVYKMRLVNKTLNVNVQVNVSIEEGRKTNFSLSLEDATGKSRTSRK